MCFRLYLRFGRPFFQKGDHICNAFHRPPVPLRICAKRISITKSYLDFLLLHHKAFPLRITGMAEPELSLTVRDRSIRAINEALIDLSRTVNEQYALRLTLIRQAGIASNEQMARIYEEISSYEQRHRARVSFNLNISAPGVNHRFLPIEVAEYMESLARVDIDSLGKGEEEDSKCDICQESFGRPRGGCSPPPACTITPSPTTTTSSLSLSLLSLSSPSTQQHNVNGSKSECEYEAGQPVEAANPMNSEMGEDERPENAVKLECGHIFGERCIRRWIIEGNPPTCPTCRRVLNGSERGEGDAILFRVEYLWDDILASIRLVNSNSE